MSALSSQDLLGFSRLGGYAVERCNGGGHPLAVALLTSTQAGFELMRAALGRLAGCLPKVLLSHHDAALAIDAHYQQQVFGVLPIRIVLRLPVVGIEVSAQPVGQLLGLALLWHLA